jgi:hypothetical protein
MTLWLCSKLETNACQVQNWPQAPISEWCTSSAGELSASSKSTAEELHIRLNFSLAWSSLSNEAFSAHHTESLPVDELEGKQLIVRSRCAAVRYWFSAGLSTGDVHLLIACDSTGAGKHCDTGVVAPSSLFAASSLPFSSATFFSAILFLRKSWSLRSLLSSSSWWIFTWNCADLRYSAIWVRYLFCCLNRLSGGGAVVSVLLGAQCVCFKLAGHLGGRQ